MKITDSIDWGEKLLQKGLIRTEDLKRARSDSLERGTSLQQALVRLRLIPETELMRLISDETGFPYVTLKGRQVSEELLKIVSARTAHHFKIVPLDQREGILTVAMEDPQNLHKVDDLRHLLQKDVLPVLSGETEIHDALKRYYGIGADTLEALPVEDALLQTDTFFQSSEDLKSVGDDASVVRFVKQLLQEALEKRATDIHIEPYEDELRIRKRIDGVLYEVVLPPSVRRFQSSIISRIKVLAHLDIGERRLPQDGRIKVRMGRSDLDLRVSVLPTPFGESLTIRLLTNREFLSLDRLGFLKEEMDYLRSLLRKPHGIILLTGPTGSGKTTTLYAFLNAINHSETKIITIEDPIEYQMKGITQIQVHPKAGLTFSVGLRSMLRHDPDVMMVGEIRDLETAEIAIRVALTGHLVFSTLHTNDAPGAATRLLDMGLEPYLAASSLECVIAQRLVRLICEHCREKVRDREKIPGWDGGEKGTVYRGRGCERCNGTGYHGRTVIYEILGVDREIREMILRRDSADRIREKALSRGMRSLRKCGWEKVKMGLTTPEEVMRVSMKEEGEG